MYVSGEKYKMWYKNRIYVSWIVRGGRGEGKRGGRGEEEGREGGGEGESDELTISVIVQYPLSIQYVKHCHQTIL